MRRLMIFSAALILISTVVKAQTVEDIKAEQNGEKILISYRMPGSKPGQVFKVSLYFKTAGGMETVLKTVSGDAGDMVIGGKPLYNVEWDVLKDVDELKSAEFIVRALLVNPTMPDKVREKQHAFSTMFSLQAPQPSYGARIGYMGRMGFSFQFVSGKAVIDDSNYDPRPSLFRISLDLTSRLIKTEQVQMHLLTGVTIGQTVIKDSNNGTTSYPTHVTPGLEGGFAFYLGKMAVGLTGAYLAVDLTEDGKAISKQSFGCLSIGVRF